MPRDLTFYTHPMSRGRMVRWMLEEVGATYDVEMVSYDGALKSPAYLAINPMGKVPAIRHGDAVVTETPAICAYLADAFPESGMAPPPEARAAYYRWLFFAAGPLEAATWNKIVGFEANPDQEAGLGYGNLDTVLNALEGVLKSNAYIAGERFSAADLYIGAHLNLDLNLFKTVDRRPAFVEYTSRLTAREAFKRASALDDALAAAQSQ